MKKIWLFVALFMVTLILSGCQEIASTYKLYVNETNPIKSLFFYNQTIDSRFIGYFDLEGTTGLASIDYQTYSDQSEKIYYRLIEETSNYTPDVFTIAKLDPMGDRLMGYAIYDGLLYDYYMRAGLSKNYTYHHNQVDYGVIVSPLNRYIYTNDISDYVDHSSLTLPGYEDYQVLDYRYVNRDDSGYFYGFEELNILVLYNQSLTLLKLTHPNEALLVEAILIDDDVIDGYFIKQNNQVIYLGQDYVLHVTNQNQTQQLDDVKSFESFHVFEESLDLNFHFIETSTQLLFFDDALTLLLEIDKQDDFMYVGINPYPTNNMAYVSFYYLTDEHLIKDYKYIAHLR